MFVSAGSIEACRHRHQHRKLCWHSCCVNAHLRSTCVLPRHALSAHICVCLSWCLRVPEKHLISFRYVQGTGICRGCNTGRKASHALYMTGADLQLSDCGCCACCADGRQRRAQQLAEAEGKLHRIEAERPGSRHLCTEVCSDTAGSLHNRLESEDFQTLPGSIQALSGSQRAYRQESQQCAVPAETE